LYGALPPTVHGQAARATKASKGPRALGLLELAPNGKARLIPITIMIDGQYYDAGAYKADPVPMALWSETVYEAIRTGVSQGLFTVTGALQKKDPKNGMEWLAEGTWQSASSIKAKAAKKPVSSVPRGMNDDEGPPVLRRAGSSNPKPTEPAAVPATPPPAQAGPASSPATASAAPPPSSPPAVAPATTPSTPDQAQGDAPPADKDRPELKRGKAGAISGEEAQKKAAADTSAKTSGSGPAASTTVSSEVPAQAANQTQLIPAISDSHGPDLLPYAYNMRPGEEEEFRRKEEATRHFRWTSSNSAQRRLTISDFRNKPELGGDGNRIDMAYANWALDHGVPEHEVRAEIATRDLSKKGGQRGQKAYLDRTIKAAYKYIARHH